MNIAVVILTFNEEQHIVRAIQSVKAIATLIVVVDSFSTDRTVELAHDHGAIVYRRAWKNHADQFQWGLGQIPAQVDWIIRLDADEVIEVDLAKRIRAELNTLPEDVAGVTIDRKHVFLDRWIKHGGRYPLRLLRLFRRGRGRVEQRWMDEHIIVDGRIVHFAGGFIDNNLNDISFFINKHNQYATREAVDVICKKYNLCDLDHLSLDGAAKQAVHTRYIKERLYYRLPLWFGPFGYFIFRYFVLFGFLDGFEGLVYHVLQGFWYRFLVAAKIWEYERVLASCESNPDRLVRLQSITGLRLL